MSRKLLLLDGNSIMHRAYHALPPMDANGTPTHAVFGFLTMLLRAIKDEGAEYLAVAFDPHGPTFRHEQYTEYKAGRRETPDDLRAQFPVIREILQSMDIQILSVPGFEADDMLGTVSLAANTLALNTESICYLPGFGIGSAASTVVGQSIGAKRDDLTRRLGWLCVGLGAAFMGFTGMLMYFAAPWLMSLLTPDAEVVVLGAQMLRIVAFVEPFYAVSLVCAGVFRGAGDTRVVTVLSFVSMWLVRLPMARYLAPRRGLRGVWIAMSLELAFRGVIFLCRLAFHRWENTMKKSAG